MPERRARVASRDAEEIYRTHARELTSFATTLVGPDLASDVVADAALRFLQRSNRGIENPRAYLYQSVLNESRSLHRKLAVRRRYHAPVEGTAPRDVESDVGTQLEISQALARLPARQRAAITLTYWQDLPIRDVAELLGISEGSVKKHLARGREKLRKALADDT